MTARGRVAAADMGAARQKVAALERVVKGPVLGARVVLTQEADPRTERPARAEGEVNLAGRPVRVRVAAEGMSPAVDELAEQLQRRLREHVERIITREREPAASPAGEWRHGSLPVGASATRLPAAGGARAQATQVVRARRDGRRRGGAPAGGARPRLPLPRPTQRRRPAALPPRDGRLALIAPAGIDADELSAPVVEPSRFSEPSDLTTAKAEMDALDHRFLFFVNAQSGRGSVIYLRQDGHYGQIEPS